MRRAAFLAIGLLGALSARGATPSSSSSNVTATRIVVHADAVLVADLSPALVGHGIEDVNHELIGGIYTQAVFGESFEEPAGPGGISGAPGGPARATWAAVAPVPAGCSFSVAAGDAFNGAQSQAILASGAAAAPCGVQNRGLGSGGLSLAPGVDYAVRLFAKRLSSAGGAPLPLAVALTDAASGKAVAVASATLAVDSDAWASYSATLSIPADYAGTACAQDPAPLVPCAANAEGLCASCSGALALALPAGVAGALLLDQVSLVAQSGGTGPADGMLATRRDVAALISREGFAGTPGMGLTALRLGGSAILVDGYKWKSFRGPQALRQPYASFWYSGGASSTGWGFVEFLALCEYANVSACVTTMNSGESLQDVADFLEYAYGDAATTVWGAQRAADGRPQPYKPFAIEIGNEQSHTDPEFIAQVAAFARALAAASTRLALPFRITTCIGVTPGTWPPASVLPLAAALGGPDFAPLDILLDFHVGGDNPASDPVQAFAFIASVRDALANASSPIRGAVLEENGGRHDMQRALGHARMSNRLHCIGDFVRIETAANGLQVAGRNDNGWDQGALFITQNGTYLAPHGMADVVLSAASEAAVVAVEAAGLAAAPQLDVIAVVDAARSIVTLRAVNYGATALAADVSLQGCTIAAGGAVGAVLALNASSPTAQNFPWAPLLVSPASSIVSVSPQGTLSFTFAALSVTSITVPCSGAGRVARRGLGGTPTTCDAPSSGPRSFSSMGHAFLAYNGAPWEVASDSLSVACSQGDANCFDEAITVDAPLPSSGSVSVSVDFAQQAASGDDDAGLLVRCGIAGVGPGMDAFSCYEVSLGPNKNGPGTGFVLLGAHWLPSHFQLLQQVPFDVPTGGTPHVLSCALAVTDAAVAFALSVDGKLALSFNDTSFLITLSGGHVGLRSFYSSATFSGLAVSPV